jgi:hypothetical protein
VLEQVYSFLAIRSANRDGWFVRGQVRKTPFTYANSLKNNIYIIFTFKYTKTMSLLLQSGIEKKVEQYIKGSVARVGGRVDQLVNYRKCKITDINVKDGGFGEVRNGGDVQSIISFYKTFKQQLRQEILWILIGNRIRRDRKTELLDMHFAFRNKKYQHCFDASISSNVIEHSPNPIFLLLNFYFITRENGYQFHAIPNYRYTYDSYRKPTKIEHLMNDFENMTWFEDTSHNSDYINSAIVKSGWQKAFHEKYPVSYPFMHFHVFDEKNVREMAEFMFEEVTVDIIRNDKFGDNLLIFRNKLNANFQLKYASKLDEYLRLFGVKGQKLE